MKVIHFIYSIDKTFGGTTTYMQLLANELKNNVDLIVYAGKTLNPIELSGVRVELFNPSIFHLSKLKRIFQVFLKFENPDLVHVNGIWTPQNYLFQKEAQNLGIKVVLSPHGMLEPYIIKRNSWKKKIALWLYQSKAIRTADYCHLTAIEEYNTVVNLGYSKDAAIIPNGIDLSEIKVKNIWQDKQNKKLNLLFLSRIHPKKGLDILIEAVKLIERDNFVISIAGEGDFNYLNILQQLVKKYNLEEKIIFTGGVYGGEKWDLFNSSDIFILPTHSENFGIVVIEALATGIPVLTTKGTPWEELNSKDCGWWIDLSIYNLQKVITQVLDLSTQDLKRKGLNGIKLVNEKYDIREVSLKMFFFYQWILNKIEKPSYVKLN